MDPLIASALAAAVPAATPTVSTKPVLLPGHPGRGTDLEVRVTAPATGRDLPVVVFSHGFGWSMSGYDPLVDFWASHGFVVVQPTHLDSRLLALPPEDPRTPDVWQHRIRDLSTAIDHVETAEQAVPGLAGRVDRTRIAVAGHSWGGQSASTLLGARVLDGAGAPGEDLTDSRVGAGVLLSTTGLGGSDLSPFAAEHFPFMSPDFSGLRTPTLVVAGDHDDSPLSVRGPDWFTDVYHHSPGAEALLTAVGGEHTLGGIAGYGVAETSDESPERVDLVRTVTWAYLRGALLGDPVWPRVRAALEAGATPLGTLQTKG